MTAGAPLPSAGPHDPARPGRREIVAAAVAVPCGVVVAHHRLWCERLRRALGGDIGLLASLRVEPGAGLPPAVVVFQLADCAGSRAEIGRWNGRADARVVGALVGPESLAADGLGVVLEESGIDFPVLRPTSRTLERVLRALGYERTPLVLIFDPIGRLRALRPLVELRREKEVRRLLREPAERGAAGR